MNRTFRYWRVGLRELCFKIGSLCYSEFPQKSPHYVHNNDFLCSLIHYYSIFLHNTNNVAYRFYVKLNESMYSILFKGIVKQNFMLNGHWIVMYYNSFLQCITLDAADEGCTSKTLQAEAVQCRSLLINYSWVNVAFHYSHFVLNYSPNISHYSGIILVC